MKTLHIIRNLAALTFIVIIGTLVISGCDQIKSMTGGSDNQIVGIWDKEGGATFVRNYYHFKSDGTVVFGIWKNDGTRSIDKEGKYKREDNKVLIQWKHGPTNERMSRAKLEEQQKWHHVLNFYAETEILKSLGGEDFRKSR